MASSNNVNTGEMWWCNQEIQHRLAHPISSLGRWMLVQPSEDPSANEGSTLWRTQTLLWDTAAISHALLSFHFFFMCSHTPLRMTLTSSGSLHVPNCGSLILKKEGHFLSPSTWSRVPNPCRGSRQPSSRCCCATQRDRARRKLGRSSTRYSTAQR